MRYLTHNAIFQRISYHIIIKKCLNKIKLFFIVCNLNRSIANFNQIGMNHHKFANYSYKTISKFMKLIFIRKK